MNGQDLAINSPSVFLRRNFSAERGLWLASFAQGLSTGSPSLLGPDPPHRTSFRGLVASTDGISSSFSELNTGYSTTAEATCPQ